MTKAQIQKAENMQIIKAMHSQGKTKEEIAEATGYKMSTLETYLSALGLKTPDRMKNHLEEMGRMWEEGKSLEYISKKTGFRVGSISKVLRDNGYERRKGYDMDMGEPDLIDDNTVFANDKKEYSVCMVNGKRYIDITQDFS